METKMSMTMKSSQRAEAQFVSLDPILEPKLVQSVFVESNPQEEESYDFSSCDFEGNAGEQVVDVKNMTGTMMAESQARLVGATQNQPIMSRKGLIGREAEKRGQRDMTASVKTTGKVEIGENILPKAKLGHKDQE
jgi:hypothetical protein